MTHKNNANEPWQLLVHLQLALNLQICSCSQWENASTLWASSVPVQCACILTGIFFSGMSKITRNGLRPGPLSSSKMDGPTSKWLFCRVEKILTLRWKLCEQQQSCQTQTKYVSNGRFNSSTHPDWTNVYLSNSLKIVSRSSNTSTGHRFGLHDVKSIIKCVQSIDRSIKMSNNYVENQGKWRDA